MKIVQNLWQVGGNDLTAPEDAAICLVRFEQQAALIDGRVNLGIGGGICPQYPVDLLDKYHKSPVASQSVKNAL
jgi:hypothetical protein